MLEKIPGDKFHWFLTYWDYWEILQRVERASAGAGE
jgi:hypothetical protein